MLLASHRQIYLLIYDTVSCSNVSSLCLLPELYSAKAAHHVSESWKTGQEAAMLAGVPKVQQ